MGTDKATLSYGDSEIPQWKSAAHLLDSLCAKVCISVQPGQELNDAEPENFPLIEDSVDHTGPIAGILSAMKMNPGATWLVMACDLPLVDDKTLRYLIKNQSEDSIVTAFRSANDNLPEPLCALYEPASHEVLQQYADSGINCPRKILIKEESRVTLLDLPNSQALENANTQDDYQRLSKLKKSV